MKSRSLLLAIGAVAPLIALGMLRWLRADAAESRREAPLPAAFGPLHPRVSPDGSTVALTWQGSLCRIPAGGGVLTQLSVGASWDSYPAWSPDGKHIAFAMGGSIRLVDAVSGQETRLPKPVNGKGPFWFSPDGARLLGRFVTGPGEMPVAWLDLASGVVTPVAGVPEGHAARLRGVYSPAGDWKSIIFVEHQDKENEQGGNNGPEADLWRLPIDGGAAEKIVRWPARIYAMCPDPRGDAVYAVTDNGMVHNDIWHLPLRDTLATARKLTWNHADDDMPSLDAAGGNLYYLDNSRGPTALARLALDTGESGLVIPTEIEYGAPQSELRLAIIDADTREPVTARVSVRMKNGRYHFPPEAMYHRVQSSGVFYARGEAALRIPQGEYEIRAARGLEYEYFSRDVSMRDGEVRVEIPLKRWVHMAEKGWFSGENHIHANYGYGEWYNTPATILDKCEGEDLNVANLVVANSDGNGVFDREFFSGRLDPLSKPRTLLWWNEEFRSTLWGHMTLFHLRQVVEPVYTGFLNTTNPWDIPTNGQIAQRTHWQGGASSYTHPTNNPLDFYNQPYSAKGLPVDGALGLIDVVDVMGYVYEPSVPFWYRLLNAGLRIPAAAGTDVFLNRMNCAPPGHGRVYVHLDGGLKYDAWVDGLKKGRSFVSNSPMLEFSVDGKESGAVIRMDKPGKVRVQGRVTSQNPVEKLEIIQDGTAAAAGVVEAGGHAGAVDQLITVERSGWLALRASGPASEATMGRVLGAHANPVYVEVSGKPADSRHDAAYFLEWIDRLEADIRRRNRLPEGTLGDVMTHLEQARAYYRNRVAGAGE